MGFEGSGSALTLAGEERNILQDMLCLLHGVRDGHGCSSSVVIFSEVLCSVKTSATLWTSTVLGLPCALTVILSLGCAACVVVCVYTRTLCCDCIVHILLGVVHQHHVTGKYDLSQQHPNCRAFVAGAEVILTLEAPRLY